MSVIRSSEKSVYACKPVRVTYHHFFYLAYLEHSLSQIESISLGYCRAYSNLTPSILVYSNMDVCVFNSTNQLSQGVLVTF